MWADTRAWVAVGLARPAVPWADGDGQVAVSGQLALYGPNE
mgnify:CR=1 FL=1